MGSASAASIECDEYDSPRGHGALAPSASSGLGWTDPEAAGNRVELDAAKRSLGCSPYSGSSKPCSVNSRAQASTTAGS
jgi:hypothetical protein